MKRRATVSRFRIERPGDDGRARKLVELSSRATFWQLHLAIESSLGEYARCPEFYLTSSPLGRRVWVGTPLDLDLLSGPVMNARKVRLSDHFRAPGDAARYYPRISKLDRFEVMLEAVALPTVARNFGGRRTALDQDHRPRS